MVWQVQDTLKLINLYRGVPELWNPDHPDYKNRGVRRAAIVKLAEEMQTSCVEIERKLRGVRTQFAREHVREISGQKSVWFGYQPLSFLPKEKKCFFIDESQNEPWSECEDIDEIELITPQDDDARNTVTVNDDVRIIDSETFHVSNAAKRSIDTDPKTTWKKCKKILSTELDSSYSANDEHVTFANCIVHKLRNIKSDRARSIAQYYINWVLFQAEMTNYEDDFEFDGPKEFNLFRKLKKKD